MDFKQKYFNIWSAAWQFHKEFFDIGTDAEWEKAVSKSGKILEQCRGMPEYEFVKRLLLTIIYEIESCNKRRKRGEIE